MSSAVSAPFLPRLPAELRLKVLSHLDARSLVKTGQTCRQAQSETSDPVLWRQLRLDDFSRPAQLVKDEKKAYALLHQVQRDHRSLAVSTAKAGELNDAYSDSAWICLYGAIASAIGFGIGALGMAAGSSRQHLGVDPEQAARLRATENASAAWTFGAMMGGVSAIGFGVHALVTGIRIPYVELHQERSQKAVAANEQALHEVMDWAAMRPQPTTSGAAISTR
jgi:hypothetical protein